MTYPPESRRPENMPHFEPYPVPQSTARVAQIAPPAQAAPLTARGLAPLDPVVPTPPAVVPGPAAWHPRAFESPAGPSDSPAAQDPRVAAFGTGAISADPPAVRTLVRWLAPAATGIVGLLLGIALSSGSDRPSAPVPISAPGATETVTVTPSATAAPARAVATKTVTRRVTTTAVKVTTATPPPPPTVTVRETERVTVTVQRRVAADRRQPAVPFVPRG